MQDYLGRVVLVRAEQVIQCIDENVYAVVNLAYVKDAPPHKLYAQNRQLINSIHDIAVATESQRVIHISTMAVFGYSLKSPPLPRYAQWRPGDPYVESKIHAEHLLLRCQAKAGYSLSIVRLGNVIGPGSPIWTASLAQRILEGKPIGYMGRIGYSNATYVENAASYVCHLLRQSVDHLDAFGPFHHLAEFSCYSWAQILECLATAVGGQHTLLAQPSQQYSGLRIGSLYSTLRKVSKAQAGGYLRLVLDKLRWLGVVESAILQVRKLNALGQHLKLPTVPSKDRMLFDILSAEIQFESHTLPDWHPVVSFEEACVAISNWLQRSGYALNNPQ